MGKFYAFYFRRILPAVGSLLSGISGPIAIFPAPSIQFPAPPQLLQTMQIGRL